MSTDSSIHDFDVDVICDYFSTLDRQGPGSVEATRLAVGFLRQLPTAPIIADLGCGTGGQTVTLARCLPQAKIKAVDLFPRFIDLLDDRVGREGLGDVVEGIVGSMDALPFEAGSLDAIWCEGAVYNIGFARALDYWWSFLRPGGYVAMTEATWLTNERPAEIEAFWADAYPEIDTLPHKVDRICKAGYGVEGLFVLGGECWTENYYAPQRKAQSEFLLRHNGNPTAKMLVENQRREAQMYERFADYYGYVFYICRKPSR